MSASGLLMRFITKCEQIIWETTLSSLDSVLEFSILREAHTSFTIIRKFWSGIGGDHAS